MRLLRHPGTMSGPVKGYCTTCAPTITFFCATIFLNSLGFSVAGLHTTTGS